MGKWILRLIGAFVGVLLVGNLQATHLVGGSITYRYLGFNSVTNAATYEITFKTYLDCTSPFWGVNFPEPQLEIGFYEGPGLNPPATLNQTTSLIIPLLDSNAIVPALPAGCIQPGVPPCIYEATYLGTIDLPLTFQGYYLFYDRCCRNPGTINLNQPGQQGLTFTAFIGPTLLANSSPVFTDVPVPEICINDTTGVLNTATDPDGDILVFSFVDPFWGYSGDGQNGNPPPSPPLPINLGWPPPTINWATGFNANTIFGPGGFQFINQNSGFTQYRPTTLGTFVTAIEIREFRPPNLTTPIGITRRDMQIIVSNCPVNPRPNLSTAGGSGVTSFTLEEGDTLCIPMTFFDPNGDSLFLVANGEPLDATLTNPPAFLPSPQNADSLLSTQFCWNTGCGQGRVAPYFFNVEVRDNGCLPKVSPFTFEVVVNPFPGPTVINGLQVVCPGDSGVVYSVDSIGGATYNWTITGGSIVSGNGTNQITVNWGTSTAGTLTVTTTSSLGCNSPPVSANITIQNILADAGPDQIICPGDTVQLGGSPTAFPGYQASWSPSSSLNNPNVFNPLATPSTTTTYVVTVSDGMGCSLQDSVTVSLLGLNSITLTPDTLACDGDTLTLVATGGSSYQWSPAATLSSTTGSTVQAFPDTTTTYVVTISQTNGCTISDSVTVSVISSVLADAGVDTTICNGETVTLGGNPTGPLGASFLWSAATGLNSDTVSNPAASPGNSANYILQVTDSNGCPGRDTVSIVVNPSPNANAGPNINLCPGDTAQILASGGGTYAWSPGTFLSDSTIANPQVFPDSTQVLQLTVTNGFGCTDEDSVTVVVNYPTVNAGIDLWLCPGDTAQLNATGSTTYNWSPNTGLSNDTIANPSAGPIDTVVYLLAGDPVNGCPNVDTLTIFVNPIVPTNAGPDTALCSGDTLSIGGNPTAPPGATFNWQPVATMVNNTVGNPLVFPSAPTDYIVFTSSDTCTGVDTISVTVNALPNADAGNDTTICLGDTVQLQASGGITYAWNADTTLSNDTVSNPFAFPIDTNVYVVAITDTNGCSAVDSVTLSSLPLPVIDAGLNQTICLGDTAQLSASGGVSYIWSPGTSLNDSTLTNPLAAPNQTTTYVVTGFQLTGGPGSGLCANQDSVELIIQSLPTISAGPDTAICAGDSYPFQAVGGTVYQWTPAAGLNFDTIANPIAAPSTTTTYIVSGGTPINLVVNGDFEQGNTGFTTNYNLYVAGNQVQSSDYAVTTDANLIEPTFSGVDHTTGSGQFMVVDGSTNTADQAWCQNVAVTPNTDYVFSTWVNNVVDPTLNSADPEVQLLINGSSICASLVLPELPDQWVLLSCTWNSGTATNAQLCIRTLNTDPIGNDFGIDDIEFFAPSNSCFGSDTVELAVNPLPTVDAGTDTSFCEGDTLQLQATGASNFTWSPAQGLSSVSIANPMASPSTNTSYLVVGIDTNGCENNDTIQLVVNALPVADAGDTVFACNNLPATLGGSPTGPSGATYSWTPASQVSNSTIANPTATVSVNSVFSVIVTDTNQCSSSDSVFAAVFELSSQNDTGLCSGDSVALVVNPSFGAAPYTYSWSPGASLNDSTIATPLAFPNGPTLYTVTVTAANGCVETATVNLQLFPSPVAQFRYVPDPSCDGVLVDFTDESQNADSYLWTFSNGTTSTEMDPQDIFFPFASLLQTTLSVTTVDGCTADTSASENLLTFDDYFDFEVPNVFSPNGDGLNDWWEVDLKLGLSSCTKFKIFNRWGQLLFETDGADPSWNGRTFAGKETPPGVYFYIIEVNGNEFTGSFTLLR